MQLKNEMQGNGDIRMEVEEDELRFFKIFDGKKIYSLKETVKEVFSYFQRALISHFHVPFSF